MRKSDSVVLLKDLNFSLQIIQENRNKMSLLSSRNKGKSMVDLKEASVDEVEDEPRILEWKGLLRRAFSSKKRKKKRDRSSSCSPRASLGGQGQGYMYTGMSLLKPPTPKYGKRPLGVSRSNPLDPMSPTQ